MVRHDGFWSFWGEGGKKWKGLLRIISFQVRKRTALFIPKCPAWKIFHKKNFEFIIHNRLNMLSAFFCFVLFFSFENILEGRFVSLCQSVFLHQDSPKSFRHLIFQTWCVAPGWDYGRKWGLNHVMMQNNHPKALCMCMHGTFEDAKRNWNLTWIAASCKLRSPEGHIYWRWCGYWNKMMVINKRNRGHVDLFFSFFSFHQNYNILLGIYSTCSCCY